MKPCGINKRSANDVGDFSDAGVEGEVRIISLSNAHREIEGRGDMGFPVDQQLGEVLYLRRLLRETRGGNDGGLEWAGKRNAESARTCDP